MWRKNEKYEVCAKQNKKCCHSSQNHHQVALHVKEKLVCLHRLTEVTRDSVLSFSWLLVPFRFCFLKIEIEIQWILTMNIHVKCLHVKMKVVSIWIYLNIWQLWMLLVLLTQFKGALYGISGDFYPHPIPHQLIRAYGATSICDVLLAQ